MASVDNHARSSFGAGLGYRADAIFPIVAGDEVAAGITHNGRGQLADEREHVAAKASGVGGRVARLEDAAIDAAAEVLDEGAEQAWVDAADTKISVKQNS